MNKETHIAFKGTKASYAGRCSACQASIKEVGDYSVIEVELKTITFRLCAECSKIIAKFLIKVRP